MSAVQVTPKPVLTGLARFPWMMLVIVYLIAAQYWQFPMAGVGGYIFIALAVVVLIIEVFKSGDLGLGAFFIDLFWSVVALVLAAGLLTYLWFVEQQMPSFYHWIGFVMVLADALLNPFNAYRTALRNFGVPG
ncbi:MAG: hypothetical protein RBS36_06865 [Thiomicrospira sp.]|jgi:hypothetical protein|nr:hypothetical protein [Thiomicrospira sp.]